MITINDISDEMVLAEHFNINGIFVNGQLVSAHNYAKENLPTEEEIENAREIVFNKRLQKEYVLNRKKEYPPLTDLADALYWQAQGDDSKMTAYIAAIEAVKLKYPKGSV